MQEKRHGNGRNEKELMNKTRKCKKLGRSNLRNKKNARKEKNKCMKLYKGQRTQRKE